MKKKQLFDMTELHALIAQHFSTSETGYRRVKVCTPSGRIFRYELSEFPVRPDTTPAQAASLAASIVAAKYRYCQWDKDHPEVNVEKEIVEGVRIQILDLVAKMNRRTGPLDSSSDD